MQAEHNENDQEDDRSTCSDVASASSKRVAWSGLVVVGESLYNEDREMGTRLKNWITLDNGSTLSLLSNPQPVQDIRTTDNTLVLSTNDRINHRHQETTVPSFRNDNADKHAIAKN